MISSADRKTAKEPVGLLLVRFATNWGRGFMLWCAVTVLALVAWAYSAGVFTSLPAVPELDSHADQRYAELMRAHGITAIAYRRSPGLFEGDLVATTILESKDICDFHCLDLTVLAEPGVLDEFDVRFDTQGRLRVFGDVARADHSVKDVQARFDQVMDMAAQRLARRANATASWAMAAP